MDMNEQLVAVLKPCIRNDQLREKKHNVIGVGQMIVGVGDEATM